MSSSRKIPNPLRVIGKPLVLLSAGAVLLFASAGTPLMQGDAAELEEIISELRELRRSYYSDRDARAARIDAVNSTVVVFRQDVEELKRERDKSALEIDAVSAEIESLGVESKELLSRRSHVLGKIRAFADNARSHVSSGIPYRTSGRLLAVDLFEQSESPRDAFSRMWSFCEEELRAARSGETYTDEITLPDRRLKHARFGRVGLQVLGFVTEDGQDVGIWNPKTGWSTEVDPQSAESVRTTIEILDRRRGPAHVALPFEFESESGQ